MTGGPTKGEVIAPPGLDLTRLADYLAKTCPGLLDGALRAEIIAGGKSNLTYRVWGQHQVAVLRRPPLGHVLPTAHDMAREFRVIAALHPTGFPVPRPLHLSADPGVIGAPFYLMSYVDGRVLRGQADFDPLSKSSARGASELLVETLATLHEIDPASVGLADFGRPDGFLERQVRRWYGQWERSKTGDLSTLESATIRLRAMTPQSGRTGIVHGDYRLDNVMVDSTVSRILAVLDWEMATLGDPLTDLGLLVVYTDLAAAGLAPTQPRIGPDQGFLAAAELAERYYAHGGTAAANLGWYVALGYYKLAIVSEGIHARYLRGKTVGEGFDRIGALVPELIDRAHHALDGAAPTE